MSCPVQGIGFLQLCGGECPLITVAGQSNATIVNAITDNLLYYYSNTLSYNRLYQQPAGCTTIYNRLQ